LIELFRNKKIISKDLFAEIINNIKRDADSLNLDLIEFIFEYYFEYLNYDLYKEIIRELNVN